MVRKYFLIKQSEKIIESSNFLKSLFESKKEELNAIDENLINNIKIILESIEDKKESKLNEQIEEYKGLLISKDNEISKLNDLNISKENEIKRLNKLIEEIKQGTVTQELEENFKNEKEKLLTKINNLELKIYNMKEENEKLLKEKKDENINKKEEIFEIENKNGNNKLSYEELLKIKEDIEQKNQELNVEIKLLKDNQEPNEINNDDNTKKIEELQNIITQYKTGQIIPELIQKKFDEKETELIEIKEQNKILNEKISSQSKNKTDYEAIVLKQENIISELNTLIKKKDSEILSRDNAYNKNQLYSVQLMNIIKEQKIKMEKIKKKNKEEENNQIVELKREINNLQNILELKETMILNMKKTYKNLQDKYINMTFSIKRKERDDLLFQAKILKKQKNDRNAYLYQQKRFSKIFNKKNKVQKTQDLNNISDYNYLNLSTSPNNATNKKLTENDFKNSNDINLPLINVNNSEIIDKNKDKIILEEKSKLEEINEMMKKVIDNENEI